MRMFLIVVPDGTPNRVDITDEHGKPLAQFRVETEIGEDLLGISEPDFLNRYLYPAMVSLKNYAADKQIRKGNVQ